MTAGGLLLQGLPWWVEIGFWINRTFATTRQRYYATAVSISVFVLLLGVVYVGGKLLKRWQNSDAVRAVQGLVVTVGTLVLSGFLVVVWNLSRTVRTSLEFIVIGPETGVKVLLTVVVFTGAYTISRVTKRSIKYSAGGDAITAHQREVAHHIVQFLVFIPAIIFTVGLWDVPVQSLFLGAGAVGVILGFAARQTLSGALSGFVILFARPFEVGDWIAVNDREGIVTDVTLYNTQIRTFDEEHVLVPNDTMTGSEVTNYSKTDRLRITTDVGIDYDVDIATAAAVAEEAMEGCQYVSDTPRPDVVRTAFGDSAVVLRLRYWIDHPTIQHKWRAQNEVIETVKEAFEAEDIKIPFPQRELLGREETGGFQVTEASRERLSADDRTARDVEGGRGAEESASEVSEPVEEEYGGDPTGDPVDGQGEDESDESTENRTDGGEIDERRGTDVTEPVGEEHDPRPKDSLEVDGMERDFTSGPREEDDE